MSVRNHNSKRSDRRPAKIRKSFGEASEQRVLKNQFQSLRNSKDARSIRVKGVNE